MNQEEITLANKQRIKPLLDKLAAASLATIDSVLAELYHPDAHWRGSHPINEMHGIEAIAAQVWRPLLHSFPDLERRDTIFIGGNFEGRDYVGAVGCYTGRFEQPWLDIPATGGIIYMRYGEIHQIVDGKIIQSSVIIDVLDVIRQAGFWPLPPSTGVEQMWPGPLHSDGIVMSLQDTNESEQSLALTLAMHQSLGNEIVERDELLNMSQKEYWHPKMMWYGPCGIGTGRGLAGFVDCHQRPFRIAFPKRSSGGANHYARMADGKFTATSGWPSVVAEHVGGGWLGVGATGRKVGMRVMDFYCIDEGLIRENWVPIDMIDILLQLDIDIMARVRQQFRYPTKYE